MYFYRNKGEIWLETTPFLQQEDQTGETVFSQKQSKTHCAQTMGVNAHIEDNNNNLCVNRDIEIFYSCIEWVYTRK